VSYEAEVFCDVVW